MIWEEFVLSILAITIGGGVLIVGITKITDLIKTWITRDSSARFSSEDFSRLAKAFVKHKKEMEKRMENLEAIVTQESERDTGINFEESIDQQEGNLSNDLKSGSKTRA